MPGPPEQWHGSRSQDQNATCGSQAPRKFGDEAANAPGDIYEHPDETLACKGAVLGWRMDRDGLHSIHNMIPRSGPWRRGIGTLGTLDMTASLAQTMQASYMKQSLQVEPKYASWRPVRGVWDSSADVCCACFIGDGHG